MRRRFVMSREDLEKFADARNVTKGTPQEATNRLWIILGKRMGFDWNTVAPTGEGDRFFTAEQSKEQQLESMKKSV